MSETTPVDEPSSSGEVNRRATMPHKPLWQISRRELAVVSAVLLANLAFDVAFMASEAAVYTRIDMTAWTAPLTWNTWVEGFFLACFFAQIVVLAIWTALFSGSNLFRLLVGTFILICSIYLLAAVGTRLGMRGLFYMSPRDDHDFWRIAGGWLFAVIVFYLVQIPFWTLRGVLELRITNAPSLGSPDRPNRQLSLALVFGITAFFAVPLALARGLAPNYEARALGMVVLALTCISVAFGLPYLWAMLGTKRLRWSIVAALTLSELMVHLGSWAYIQLTGTRPADWPFVVAGFRGVQVATLFVAIGNGLAARAAGYRLVGANPWRRSA
jgi:hypothetical protein